MQDTRARITLPDVLYTLLTIAFLGALWPVVDSLYHTNIDLMRTGTEYLYLLLLPLGILVIFTTIFVKATAGVDGR